MKLRVLKEVKLEIGSLRSGILNNLISSVLAYDKVKNVAHSPVVFYLLLESLPLKESMQAKEIAIISGDPNNEQILTYIHGNIYSREKITVKTIALHFNISLKYFSNYFKRSFGVAYP
jgi:YesN/AraC family two-component response regulator